MAEGLDREHIRHFASIAFDPVFIIGDHRSGTTVLYQLLSSTAAFNVLTTYDVIHYDSMVTNHLEGRTDVAMREVGDEFERLGLGDRLIDAVRVRPDLPEEYGFVIGDSSRPCLTPRNLPTLVELCEKVRFIGGDKPVLLKNPWDVLTFAFVKQTLPRARFIFIHRHPLNVMSSQLQAMRSLYAELNPYLAMLSPWYRAVFNNPVQLQLTRSMVGPHLGLGARVTGRHVARVARYYLDNISSVPAADYIELRYEDLCREPDETLHRVLQFLEITPDPPVRARDHVSPRAAAVLPEVARRHAQIQARLADYSRRHGYGHDAVSATVLR